jgi:hypothetical protein
MAARRTGCQRCMAERERPVLRATQRAGSQRCERARQRGQGGATGGLQKATRRAWRAYAEGGQHRGRRARALGHRRECARPGRRAARQADCAESDGERVQRAARRALGHRRECARPGRSAARRAGGRRCELVTIAASGRGADAAEGGAGALDQRDKRCGPAWRAAQQAHGGEEGLRSLSS